MIFVDTHAHLFWPDFETDREQVLRRAAEAGVGAILNLGTNAETSRICVDLADEHEQCWAAVGFHPHNIEDLAADREQGLSQLRSLMGHPKVVAIGETGLDFYRGRGTEEAQRVSLKAHFELARMSGLPIVLHSRGTGSELREALEEFGAGVKAILHCFVGDEAFGRWAVSQGHFLGLGGIFTFPTSDMADMVRSWDIDHVLLETDSPFLSPVPHRGKRNEPAFILHTARAIARALGISVEELAERTTRNACRVLGIPQADLGPGVASGD